MPLYLRGLRARPITCCGLTMLAGADLLWRALR